MGRRVTLGSFSKYIIKRILRKYKGRIKSICSHGACIVPDQDSEIEEVLQSIYLDPEEVCKQIEALERLTELHQSASDKDLERIEAYILHILGIKVLT